MWYEAVNVDEIKETSTNEEKGKWQVSTRWSEIREPYKTKKFPKNSV